LTIAIVGYETLSSEYYDSARHPTCADFRYASLQLISGYLSLARFGASPRVLEVGAGRSVFVDLSVKFPHLLQRLVATDKSQGMIRHTVVGSTGADLACANAEQLPFGDGAFDLVIASLGDPYNTEAFWREMSRVLTTGGRCIFTTPAASWSDRYRDEQQSGDHNVAVFETREGATVGVPSFVLSPVDQMAFVEGLGLTATDVWTFTRDMFPEGAPMSPKIARFTLDATPVITQYVVRKRM
jgi:SAM-dependent methyltransferase